MPLVSPSTPRGCLPLAMAFVAARHRNQSRGGDKVVWWFEEKLRNQGMSGDNYWMVIQFFFDQRGYRERETFFFSYSRLNFVELAIC